MKMLMKAILTAFAVVTQAVGAVTADGAPSVPPTPPLAASINGNGHNFGGFTYEYWYPRSGVPNIVASGLSRPRGVVFDSAGNLFVTTSTFDPDACQEFFGEIVKITPGGVQSVFATMECDTFPEGLAIDSTGNIFVNVLHDNPPSGPPSFTIEKFTPNGAQSTFASPPGAQGFGLAFDRAGNLYTGVNYEIDASQIWKFLPDGTPSVFATASSQLYGFGDLAFDRFGNLLVSSFGASGSGSILKFRPNGTESTFATNLTFPRGLAFDTGGSLLVAEIFTDVAGTAPGNILKFTPGGQRSVFASGIAQPEFLALPKTGR